MKLSEYISRLVEIENDYGDIDVHVFDTDYLYEPDFDFHVLDENKDFVVPFFMTPEEMAKTKPNTITLSFGDLVKTYY